MVPPWKTHPGPVGFQVLWQRLAVQQQQWGGSLSLSLASGRRDYIVSLPSFLALPLFIQIQSHRILVIYLNNVLILGLYCPPYSSILYHKIYVENNVLKSKHLGWSLLQNKIKLKGSNWPFYLKQTIKNTQTIVCRTLDISEQRRVIPEKLEMNEARPPSAQCNPWRVSRPQHKEETRWSPEQTLNWGDGPESLGRS